jgi:putative intracellular protease/amidase
MIRRVLVPLANTGHNAGELAVPYHYFLNANIQVHFATVNGEASVVDDSSITGKDTGPFGSMFVCSRENAITYQEQLAMAGEFREPFHRFKQARDRLDTDRTYYDGLYIPGGHGVGMKTYVESQDLHEIIARFMMLDLPVASICHGVLALAKTKSIDKPRRSVLAGRRVTGVSKWQEFASHNLTRCFKRDLSRDGDDGGGAFQLYYPYYMQDIVQAHGANFVPAPLLPSRDSFARPTGGHVIRDGNLVTASWEGDIHTLSRDFVSMVAGKR